MKKTIIILLLISCNFLSAQEKYKGLLWEISGNGLQKNSYLYGNMHISGKIAYHLGEEFFKAIKGVDGIALESNPILWLDEIIDSEFANDYLGRYEINKQPYKGFYQDAFEVKIIENKTLAKSIAKDHYLTNWLLYRSNKTNSEFEENTFLDMFIYQAGSKNNKPIYSLENFKKTSISNKLAKIPDYDTKDVPEWYTKLTKEKSGYELLLDAYRDKDLDMLDSIQKAISTKNYVKYMLYNRNIIMANNIDSLIQMHKSLFIGIGAAHLPKDKGVISLLRKKGYIVKAMTTTISVKSKKEREELSKKKKIMPLKNKFSSDLFSLKIPGRMYETPSLPNVRQFFSPELTNGTFYLVNQLSTYDYFKGINRIDYISKIDSLLFENIPGKIISKKRIIKNGFKGIDIVNLTKTGNYQRYQIIVSPLQIFIFKMGANDDYAQQQSNNFFNSIKLKELTDKWEIVSPIKSDFKVKVPGYYQIKNNTKITSLYENTELEAYDEKDNNYYFLKRASLFDNDFIEKDNFELKRIITKFCKQFDIDSVQKVILKNTKYPTILAYAKTADSSSFLALKLVIKGAYYYLMANISPTYKKSNPFFDSFQLTDFTYTFEFKEKIDSLLYFKVNSNYLLPNDYKQVIEKAWDRKDAKKEVEDTYFKRKRKTDSFYSENFEQIDVEFIKNHRYREYKNIDSLWNSELRYVQSENKLVLKNKKSYKKNDIYYLDATFTDTGSVRSIIVRLLLKQGALYTLRTTSDTISKPSKFVAQFFNTFTPLDTNIGISPLISKSEMFFNAINGTDSLEKERALKSVKTHVIFKDKDVPKLMYTISNYPFPKTNIEAKEQMIKDLGARSNPKIIPYYENLYKKVEDTAMYQLAILKGLSRQKSKKAEDVFLKLLDYDIPLSSSTWGISSLIRSFNDSLPLAQELFPNILNYTFVSDYKKPIYKLLATLIDSNRIKPKKYAKYYKQILREAKIELKSQISYEQKKQSEINKKTYYYASYKNKGNNLLVNYTTMLIPFYVKKDVKEFFIKLKKVQDYKVQTSINCKLIKNNIKVNNQVWKKLAENTINFSYLYEQLQKINRLDLFPTEDNIQFKMAKSLLFQNNFNFNKDSLVFIKTVKANIKNKKGLVYFFKAKKQKDEKWKLAYIGLEPLDPRKVNLETEVEKKGIKIKDGKDINELINDKLRIIEIIGHKRAREKDKRRYSSYY